MSRTAWSHARRTVSLGVSMRTFGRRGAARRAERRVDGVARQRDGRPAPSRVTGSHLRQVCQTPFGRDLGDEDQPPVGELRRRVAPLDGDDQLAPEVAVDVRRPQLAARPEPAAC